MERQRIVVFELARANKSYFLLVYDADCGPCSRFKRMINFLDTHGRFRYNSLVRSDELGLLNSVPTAQRHRSFHLISPEGSVSSGALAIPTLLAQLPFGGIVSAMVSKAPGGMRLVKIVYSTFSRLHDSGSCNYQSPHFVLEGKGNEVLDLQQRARESKLEVYLKKKVLFTWKVERL